MSITPNGRLAVVRREGSASLGIVDLTTGTLGSIALSGAITDVDVTADGKSAVAIVRDTAEVAVIPLAGGIPNPATVQHVTIAGETIGSASIAADGKTVLLYTNAVAAERLTVLTLGTTPTYRVVKLHAPVLAVFATADASNADRLPQRIGGTDDDGDDRRPAERPRRMPACPRRPPPTRSAWFPSLPTSRP